MTIFNTLKEITTAIEQKKYAVGIFLDLKKAFDKVDHNSLDYEITQIWN